MDPKRLRKQYMRIIPKLNNALLYVQSQLSDLPPSEFVLDTNIKPYTSVKRKMAANRVRDPLELSDLVRGRLFFSDQFRFDEVLDILKKLFGDKLKEAEKGSDRAEDLGLVYPGIMHVNLDVDDINFEMRLLPIEFRPYEEFLHQIYAQLRDPKESNKLSDKQKEFLRKINNRLRMALDEKSKNNRRNI